MLLFCHKTLSSHKSNGDPRLHISLVLVHPPLAEQTIVRGPNTGVYPSLQDNTNSAPGLKNLWSPSTSTLAGRSGLEHTEGTHGL